MYGILHRVYHLHIKIVMNTPFFLRSLRICIAIFSLVVFSGCINEFFIPTTQSVSSSSSKQNKNTTTTKEQSTKKTIYPSSTKQEEDEQEAPTQPTAFTGTMTWHTENNSSTSTCGGLIKAEITVDLTRNLSSGKLKGSGDITYNNIDYSEKRMCSDCMLTGQNSTFSITGTTHESSSTESTTLELHPQLTTSLTETAQSPSCFSESDQSSQEEHNLQFSLEQAGFFDEWEITSPNSTTTKQTKKFSWEGNDQKVWGSLTLTAQ